MNTYEQYQKALDRYYKARMEHDKAYKAFGGYSWYYYGHEYVNDMHEAEKECRELFQQLIEEQVEKMLVERGDEGESKWRW